MLFMVIERFKPNKTEAIGERFRHQGRMLGEAIECRASWVASSGSRCFQVVEAENLTSLTDWMAKWQDLIDFEMVPVIASAEFWST